MTFSSAPNTAIATARWRLIPVVVGALPFYVTPLILGLTYLAAAALGRHHPAGVDA